MHRFPARSRQRRHEFSCCAPRLCLRQDPDVIMIGEMRDAVSIWTAMTAAETGHLVLSTLAHKLRFADDRPHHRFIPGRTAGSGDVPARRDARRDYFRALASAHFRRPYSGDGNHDRESRHPQPHPRAQNISDRSRHRDQPAGRHGHAQPLARRILVKNKEVTLENAELYSLNPALN